MKKKALLGGLLALALLAALALALWPREDGARLVGDVPLPGALLQPQWAAGALFEPRQYHELRSVSPLPASTLSMLFHVLLLKEGWKPLGRGDTFYNPQAGFTYQHSADDSIFAGPAFVTSFSIAQRGDLSEVTVRSDELDIGMMCK
jgi:hypothetical protein